MILDRIFGRVPKNQRLFWIGLIIIDLILIVLAMSGALSGYITHILILITIYAILAISLNIAVGFTGLLNLGHVAFFGVGAYTSTILVKNVGAPYLLGLLGAIIMGGIFGYVLLYATKKLKGDYFALVTLGFSFVMYSIFLNWKSLTRGPLGIPGIPKPEIFGTVIRSNDAYLLFATIIAVLVIIFSYRLTRSPFGRLLEATRDDEVSVEVMGKNTTRLKLLAMTISGAIAGIAGSLFAHYITFIDPFSFSIPELILIYTIIIVGGLASNRGSIAGAVVLLILPELLRFLPIPSTLVGPLRQIIYAVIVLAVILYKPRGIFGQVDLE